MSLPVEISHNFLAFSDSEIERKGMTHYWRMYVTEASNQSDLRNLSFLVFGEAYN
jgi:hypothetical protein